MADCRAGQHDDEDHQIKMIQCQQQQANQCGDHHIDAIQEKQSRAFLHRYGIHEAVDHFECMNAVEGSGDHAWKTIGQIPGNAHKNPPLDQFGHVVLKSDDESLQ